MQRQQGIVVFKEVVDRLLELLLLAVGFGKGEEAEFLQRFDIGLRQRRQFFVAVDALGPGLEALQRIGRELSSKVQACRTPVIEPSGA
jgi:hypothetical protein